MSTTATPETYERVAPSECWRDPVLVMCKRGIDICFSGLLLLVLSPLFFALGLAVWATSQGSVFYAWKVVGKNGRPFTGYKFRTMVANADQMKATLQCRNEMSGPMFKMTDDPRVTPVGRWMRRYSLDELPQLYSVWKGDMSLVGPRPPLVTEYVQFSEYQKQKLMVTPGITCLWQTSGRNNICSFDEWVALDLDYIRRWSLGLDFEILWRTLRVVVNGSGK